MSVFRGQIPWRFSISKINIAPAAPDLELILFPLWYWPIMNAHTMQQQDKMFETDFIGSQNPYPTQCAPFVTKSYIYIYIYIQLLYISSVFQITRQRVFRLHVWIFWQVDEWLKLQELGSVTWKNSLRRSKPWNTKQTIHVVIFNPYITITDVTINSCQNIFCYYLIINPVTCKHMKHY